MRSITRTMLGAATLALAAIATAAAPARAADQYPTRPVRILVGLPAKTPKPIVDLLYKEMAKAVADPQVIRAANIKVE